MDAGVKPISSSLRVDVPFESMKEIYAMPQPPKSLSDKAAKKILLTWPGRTNDFWLPPKGRGFWIRGQPKDGKFPGPVISVPGAALFKTQPDGLWVHFNSWTSCDVIVIEVCRTSQNLNDKRSRYMPTGSAKVLQVKKSWLNEEIKVRGGGSRKRRVAAGGVRALKDHSEISVPIRFLRVLYCLPNALYQKWGLEHVPTGYEFFCAASSLRSHTSKNMRTFLKQLSSAAHFFTKIKFK